MVKYDLDQITHDDILNGKMLLVDKPLKWTSFDVVKYVRGVFKRHTQFKKIKVGVFSSGDEISSSSKKKKFSIFDANS